jgi:hypothetical protein
VNGSGRTIIDATGRSSGFTSAVAFGSGLGRDTVLDGFTIVHGLNFEGGNISCYDASPTISNCFIYGGRSVYGAGIYCYDGAPLIINCIISGNLCAYGGGIYSEGSPTIMNCTISQNRADNGGTITDARGAGISCGPALVINTIIWGNTANGLPDTISSIFVTVSYSDIEGGWTGTGNINSNPQFVMPGYWSNNGTVYTGDDYWVPGDFHLQAISPCIDSGTSNDAPSIDIEKTPRPQGAGFDMGAYEYGATTVISLSSLDAIPQSNKVVIKWSTESEINNAGFNLYRSEAEDGEYAKINTSLISAQGSSTESALYDFTDTDVTNRKTYYYKLEDIDFNGKSTMHGPVSATPRWWYGLR